MLLSNFDLLATAPGGVARLRELILTLAVQGKLVPQDPKDEPASELLKKIRVEKDRLIAEGKIRRDKPLEEIEDDEKPFLLPVGWTWVKGRELFSVVRGITYQKVDARDAPTEGHLPILRANNIRGSVNLDDLVYVPASLVSEDQLLRSGDYVVCLASGSKNLVGKAAPFRERLVCSFGAFCGAIRPVQEVAYFSVYLASPMYRDSVSEASAGIGINNLKGSSLLDLDIALPPEAEQSRIVTRVEELMRLCDALEASGQLKAAQHAQLVTTLLATLTDSATPEELADNWQRVATHFDTLLDRPEAVDALEQTILQLAVRGLLVPQDPADEPASELLKKIRAEKDRLIAEGKIKRDKPLAEIAEEDQPFELPAGWEWVRFGEASINRDGERIPVSSSDRDNLAKTYDYYGASGVIDKIDGFLFDKTLLLIGEDGANLINRSTPIAFLAHGKYWVNNHAHVIDTTHQELMDYLTLFINAISLEPYVTGTAQPKMNQAKLNSIVVALPPLAEQSRIVARVESLRSLCADLRQRLSASQTTQEELAVALVESQAA